MHTSHITPSNSYYICWKLILMMLLIKYNALYALTVKFIAPWRPSMIITYRTYRTYHTYRTSSRFFVTIQDRSIYRWLEASCWLLRPFSWSSICRPITITSCSCGISGSERRSTWGVVWISKSLSRYLHCRSASIFVWVHPRQRTYANRPGSGIGTGTGRKDLWGASGPQDS